MKNSALPVIVLLASTMSMAAGSLWNMDVDAYQVQIPSVGFDDNLSGWWYAYAGDSKNGQTVSFEPITKNDDGTYKLIMTNEEDGGIIPGGNLVEGVGLRVKMSAAGGSSGTPAIAGLGFDWTKNKTSLDLSSHAGYCIGYSWDGSVPLQMELGWDEETNGYDSWYAELPAKDSLLDLPWEKFKQDGWDEAKKPISVAVDSSVSLKIRLKNPKADEVKGTLTIKQLGWSGECGAIGKNAIGSVAKASSVKAILSGRTLSFSGVKGAAKAEILNLQGQVVVSGSTASAMNLAGLDAGVYMVRVAGANLTQKILLK